MTPEAVMLGASAASAGCCMAAPTGAAMRARALALLMVALMAAMVWGASPPLQYALAGTVVVAALVLVLLPSGVRNEHGHHRAIGAGLMVLLALIHLHLASGAVEHSATHGGHHPVSTPGDDLMLIRVLLVASLCFVPWTALVITRIPKDEGAVWPRLEHGFMATSLVAMAVAMH